MKKLKGSLLLVLSIFMGCNSNIENINSSNTEVNISSSSKFINKIKNQDAFIEQWYKKDNSNNGSNTNKTNGITENYQKILSSWDTDKSDKGLTLDEVKSTLDKNNDGFVSNQEFSSTKLNSNEIKLVQERLKSRKNLLYKLVELDSRVFPLGVSNISASDIQQARRNVCYFLAGLAALANHNRTDDILQMIDKNRDGTFTINFPGVYKQTKTYTVPFPSKNDLNKLIYKGKNGSAWVAILVNAYYQTAMAGDRPYNVPFVKKQFKTDYGLTWEGIETQTGNVADSYLTTNKNESLMFNTIKTALQNKKVVLIDTFLRGNYSGIGKAKKNQYKIIGNHIISVIGVDTNTKEIILRDPYGKTIYYDNNGKEIESRKTDGVFRVKSDKIRDYFLDISIETNKKGSFRGIKKILKRFLGGGV